jgi:CheY-like chemotaxis protein
MIHVHASARELNENETEMRLVIKDNGTGIESSKLEKIFEEYAQADNEVSIRYGGTGLGLSIVKKLVELFNGEIHIESRKGAGTKVTCNLVFTKGDPDLIVATGSDPVLFTLPEGLRILVADDEPYNQELIAMILEKWNVSYDMAKDGLEAIELIKKKPYEVVLMDVRMPVINGIMATRFIRETLGRSKQEVVVIGITADISRHADENLDELFNHILVKPFLEEELYGAITGQEKTGRTGDGGAGAAGGEQAGAAQAERTRAAGKRTGAPAKENSGTTKKGPGAPAKEKSGTTEKGPGAPAKEKSTVTAAEQPPPQDVEHVADLSGLLRDAGNDMLFVREMIDQFAASTRSGLNEIRSALEQEHFSEIADLAHKLAPASRHLKITRLVDKLKEIEKLAGNKNGSEIVILLDEAELLTSRAVQSLNVQYEKLTV